MKALDYVINLIKDRFNHPEYVTLMSVENLILKCTSKTNYDKKFQTVTHYYGNGLNKQMLRLHLETLQASIPADIQAFKDVITYSKDPYLRTKNVRAFRLKFLLYTI